jgi:hypothetical protein
MTTNKTRKTVAKRKPKQTVEEMILGVEPQVEKVTTVDYESAERFYRVTNLRVENATSSEFNGTQIEAFIGSTNAKARKELMAGAKTVITVDRDGKEVYKIEVI